ncbi:hypothetical protein BKA67DRAFT_663576 [Truncatella angustata]|uniref:DUF7053 domain-containing protein n=1 Tax=Truncatella angustata TaxID=152316 RepID=A0A9P8UAF5_9PEZI|nr:uncharacterized protein BKA67DRAFT_663576 [Truncatella angustata]KAH6647239.1 hypothetical protein BKA67DRAFT_663576 [Truncatella angustata]KAH8194557.1 hypothetical protein TruAng_011279 [Truncatella angustata]
MAPVQTSISTPMPAGTSASAVIAVLHDHDQYIKMACPQHISYKLVSGTPGAGLDAACVYEVTDKKPIGQTTYPMTLTNRAGGIDAFIDGKAPTGAIRLESAWRVVGDKIEETVTIDSNMLMNKMIKSNVEKSHPAQHQGLIQAVRA